MNKAELRKTLKNRQPVDATQKATEEKHLLEFLWDTITSHAPTCIGLYAALKNEVDLSLVFQKCQSLGITTAYPRINGDYITFHIVNSHEELLSTPPHGIHEPSPNASLVVPDLLIVPGLAFTKEGKRLGRGKGHYDRYLSQYHPKTISLAFSWQLFDDLPTEPHDVIIDKIIR